MKNKTKKTTPIKKPAPKRTEPSCAENQRLRQIIQRARTKFFDVGPDKMILCEMLDILDEEKNSETNCKLNQSI